MRTTAAPKLVLAGAALLLLTHGADAATHSASTKAEREQTRELNEQQLLQAQRQNASLSVNADSAVTDAAANMADNSPPAAAPTIAVQQASNLPQMVVTPAASAGAHNNNNGDGSSAEPTTTGPGTTQSVPQ